MVSYTFTVMLTRLDGWINELTLEAETWEEFEKELRSNPALRKLYEEMFEKVIPIANELYHAKKEEKQG